MTSLFGMPNDLHDAQQRLASMLEQAARQQGEIEALRKDAEELQATFDLTWSANLRAINRWREKTGQQLVFPHHDDLVIWLLAELEKVNPAAIASVATSQVKG